MIADQSNNHGTWKLRAVMISDNGMKAGWYLLRLWDPANPAQGNDTEFGIGRLALYAYLRLHISNLSKNSNGKVLLLLEVPRSVRVPYDPTLFVLGTHPASVLSMHD